MRKTRKNLENMMGVSIRSRMNHDRVLGGVLGVSIGDALGVPVEFESRESLDAHPVKTMRGYGTYDQPPGTWSDDTSLTLATMDALIKVGTQNDGFLEMISANFLSWLFEGAFTAHGTVFDIGNTTREAILNLKQGIKPSFSGINREFAQANGSLMRILPASIYFSIRYQDNIREALRKVHAVSAITHAHPSCLIACGIYTFFVKYLMEARDTREAYKKTCNSALKYYHEIGMNTELKPFTPLLSGRILEVERENINSTGYVIDSIEAAFWALLTTSSFKDAVLQAVNLGGDTDTIGAITGGLAGMYYGLQAIPQRWIKKLVKSNEILELSEKFVLLLEEFC